MWDLPIGPTECSPQVEPQRVKIPEHKQHSKYQQLVVKRGDVVYKGQAETRPFIAY
jgi:Na+-translocating ferredoxin:NAD+ oxidoreductase RnfC subunit